MSQLQQFQAFLYANIPLVSHMQMQLLDLDSDRILASAPLSPNINDKATVFGGSSAALMTICGWSLIKMNLEGVQVSNDVVIHHSKLNWHQAQRDDMKIKASLSEPLDWLEIAENIQSKNRATKIKVHSQIMNQAGERCSDMHASYVILKQ